MNYDIIHYICPFGMAKNDSSSATTSDRVYALIMVNTLTFKQLRKNKNTGLKLSFSAKYLG